MTSIAYSFIKLDSVYGYESFGTFFGVKVLQEVYLSELSEYRYILQSGKALAGEDFVPYDGGKDLSILSLTALKDSYGKQFKKDNVIKQGDVLKDSTGKHLFLVKGTYIEGKPKLYRISAGYDGAFGTLKYYELEYGTLVQVKDDADKRFSEV